MNIKDNVMKKPEPTGWTTRVAPTGIFKMNLLLVLFETKEQRETCFALIAFVTLVTPMKK